MVKASTAGRLVAGFMRGARAISVIMIICGWLLIIASPARAQEASAGGSMVYLLTFQGAVTPVLQNYLEQGIEDASAAGAQAIVLELDTPGGSVDVTKSINQLILTSPVPVIAYVAPVGAQAGSAGTFITLAAHVAAMAPSTSIGAASPVDASGAEVGETMASKVTNILSADIENLATRRGDAAVEWAIAAVREAQAATATQALELGVIDFIAPDVASLLMQVDGFVVNMPRGELTLHTADAFIHSEPMDALEHFFNFITNPTIATLLVTVGTAGLLAEMWNPGTWIPGVIGAICVLLGLYALGQMDANFAGLALMALGLALFVAEALTPSFGALLVAGLVAFGLGSMLLFNRTAYPVPWPTIWATAGGLAIFAFFISAKALAAQRRQPLTGEEALIGMTGYAKQDLVSGIAGSVYINGEYWTATLDAGEVKAGEPVRVIERRGLELLITRA